MKLRAAFAATMIAAVLATGPATGQVQTSGAPTEDGVKIRIIVEGTALSATLDDSAAGRDFASLLPMELTLSDYHGIEKIADLPRRLSTEGAPEGVDPEIGDITYFAPWGNLALFYRDFGYSRGLVRLGRIEGGIAALGGSGSLEARIERVEEPE